MIKLKRDLKALLVFSAEKRQLKYAYEFKGGFVSSTVYHVSSVEILANGIHIGTAFGFASFSLLSNSAEVTVRGKIAVVNFNLDKSCKLCTT